VQFWELIALVRQVEITDLTCAINSQIALQTYYIY